MAQERRLRLLSQYARKAKERLREGDDTLDDTLRAFKSNKMTVANIWRVVEYEQNQPRQYDQLALSVMVAICAWGIILLYRSFICEAMFEGWMKSTFDGYDHQNVGLTRDVFTWVQQVNADLQIRSPPNANASSDGRLILGTLTVPLWFSMGHVSGITQFPSHGSAKRSGPTEWMSHRAWTSSPSCQYPDKFAFVNIPGGPDGIEALEKYASPEWFQGKHCQAVTISFGADPSRVHEFVGNLRDQQMVVDPYLLNATSAVEACPGTPDQTCMAFQGSQLFFYELVVYNPTIDRMGSVVVCWIRTEFGQTKELSVATSYTMSKKDSVYVSLFILNCCLIMVAVFFVFKAEFVLWNENRRQRERVKKRQRTVQNQRKLRYPLHCRPDSSMSNEVGTGLERNPSAGHGKRSLRGRKRPSHLQNTAQEACRQCGSFTRLTYNFMKVLCMQDMFTVACPHLSFCFFSPFLCARL